MTARMQAHRVPPAGRLHDLAWLALPIAILAMLLVLCLAVPPVS